jgi:hypothetical protein
MITKKIHSNISLGRATARNPVGGVDVSIGVGVEFGSMDSVGWEVLQQLRPISTPLAISSIRNPNILNPNVRCM